MLPTLLCLELLKVCRSIVIFLHVLCRKLVDFVMRGYMCCGYHKLCAHCPHMAFKHYDIIHIEGKDYIGSMGNLTFAPREQRKVIQVPIVNDILLETKEEIFFVRFMVTSSAPGLLEGVSMVTVTITDDDCK